MQPKWHLGGPQIHAFICVLPPLPCPQPDNMAQIKNQVIAQLKSITGEDSKQAGDVLAFVEDLPDDKFTQTFQNAEQALGYWARKAGGVVRAWVLVRAGWRSRREGKAQTK